jgi:hypothetical protein
MHIGAESALLVPLIDVPALFAARRFTNANRKVAPEQLVEV